jgi:murein DD-endopeptidase MepM/ murein hydrolase activator NlpD
MRNITYASFYAVLMGVVFTLPTSPVFAVSIGDLKDLILDRNQKIERLESEIKKYEDDLKVVGEEKKTLQSAINELDIGRKKVSTDITLTQNKIGATDLEINRLELEIEALQAQVERNRAAVGESLRRMDERENDSLLEVVLAHRNVSEVWDDLETLGRFQSAVRDGIAQLNALQENLHGKKGESEEKRNDLSLFKRELTGKKQVLDENRKTKDALLSVTKNKETDYQVQLAQKKAAYDQFLRELQNYESQLQFAVDPSRIPKKGTGILAPPLKDIYITQRFGNTAFAQSGAYQGKGHNGVDFRASVGTSVHAALSGEVLGTGNTDQYPGCYSYGKWALIRHNNGLTTLYAHLSVISVSAGESVKTGDIVGYSGSTGYSTGPHLHFGVYLSEAVRLVKLSEVKQITNCGAATLPVSPLEGYLNPLDYLSI